MRMRWIRVPIIEPLDLRTIWEHTPLDYYRYGEYPRFIRPVGAHQPRLEWRRVPVETVGAKTARQREQNRLNLELDAPKIIR